MISAISLIAECTAVILYQPRYLPAGFEINAYLLARGKLKSIRASYFSALLARRAS